VDGNLLTSLERKQQEARRRAVRELVYWNSRERDIPVGGGESNIGRGGGLPATRIDYRIKAKSGWVEEGESALVLPICIETDRWHGKKDWCASATPPASH